MTDAAILELFDDVIEAQEKLASKYDDTLIEIPPGKPQIRYSEGSDQWVPRGDVLRSTLTTTRRANWSFTSTTKS